MRKYLFFSLLVLVFGCSFFKKNIPTRESKNSLYVLVKKTRIDSLKNLSDSLQTLLQTSEDLIICQELRIDSLYEKDATLQDSIKFLNSTIRIKNHSNFPDSFFFASYKFNLRNERLREKFIKCYKSELMYAYRYIPRSSKYFPIIEEILLKYNLPDDLKYLAVAESYLSPLANSSAGATGYWQFMESTAKYYDLHVNQFVDMRADIFASTKAACEYILWAHKSLQKIGANDLLLAICSFNAGLGNIKRSIKEQGGKDFFSLIQRMSETDNYIWRAIAIKYIFENEEKIFTKKFDREQNLLSVYKTVTLKLNGYYKLDDWAQAQGTVIKKVWELNPWIKIYQRSRYRYSPINDVILSPGTYTVLIPQYSIPDTEKLRVIEKQFLNKNTGYFAVEHIVKRGENLSIIAKRYNTTVSELMQKNGLHSTVIYPGQRLNLLSTQGKYYVVKTGDSLYSISKRVGVSEQILVKKNNLVVKNKGRKNIVYIYPGQKIFY
ncbi:MAG: LysM peptidoglycan-binding domain-containing protein [Candidatus Cloacimonetes bacterium]|nr:LysM peptidoglycan-binding domain-containing protein [Candidatus Cloacimonadota bacterium]MBL7086353.1 LysM peptidoglycan-binding domain-containing protein [Candidatus Cloacimonadota bacterium]